MQPESNPDALDPMPDGLVEAGSYGTERDAFEHGLVVLAMGRACWLMPGTTSFRLMVEPYEMDSVRRQLSAFDRESVGWPPAPVEDTAARQRIDLTSPLLWALGVLVIYWGEETHPAWIGRGELDAEALFRRHEWWRPVTALFLHSDSTHVVSNGLSGILVFAAVVSTLGRWRGWLALAIAAIAGNVAAAAVNVAGPYHSIGASTAVFAGVGILAGRGIRIMTRAPRAYRWRAMFIPLMAGFTVLGLYGAGGVHIDVIAHLTGFIAGVITGSILGHGRTRAMAS